MSNRMAILENWLPPTRENWELIVYLFQFFPIITVLQYSKTINDAIYGMGKTSNTSRFNIPGKIGWLTMEVPGFLVLLYCMYTIPLGGISSLPWENKAMGACFVIHYLYRSIIFPIIAPSMSPISPLVWLGAVFFQVFNGVSFGGYVSGYGPTTSVDWYTSGKTYKVKLGILIWAIGLLGNIYHDDVLREIRRKAMRDQKKRADAVNKGKPDAEKKGVHKVYQIPESGLFRWIFYPHYLCEWIEWSGLWLMGGNACLPARNFVVNEVTTMLPRAIQGKAWYEDRFGKEKTKGKKAIVPGIL